MKTRLLINSSKTNANIANHYSAFSAIILATSLLLTSCTKLSQAHTYFLNRCAADGPTKEQDFTIKYPPFNIDEYYATLQNTKGHFSITERAHINYKDKSYPIYHIQARITHKESNHKPTLLVIAGVHGNELAALLAIPRVLHKLQQMNPTLQEWNISFLVPANPVGASHLSRYNGQGCDINRDFGSFDTPEARLIRTLIEEVKPDLVLAPHEGPQAGFFMIATAATDRYVANELLKKIQTQSITLADESFLGLSLSTPGLSHEGNAMATLKRLLRLGSLGTYLEAQHTGTITTESNWSSDNLEERINSHVFAILALLTLKVDRQPSRTEPPSTQ